MSVQRKVLCYLVKEGAQAAKAQAQAVTTKHTAWAKTVYFVRHGKGEHNQAADRIGDIAYEHTVPMPCVACERYA